MYLFLRFSVTWLWVVQALAILQGWYQQLGPCCLATDSLPTSYGRMAASISVFLSSALRRLGLLVALLYILGTGSWYLVDQIVLSLACFWWCFYEQVFVTFWVAQMHSWGGPSCSPLLSACNASPSKLCCLSWLLFGNVLSISLLPPVCLLFWLGFFPTGSSVP